MILSMAAWVPSALAQDDVAASPDVKLPAKVGGTWTGPVDLGQDGSGTLTLDIMQNVKILSGDFTTDLGAGHSGPFTGKINGDSLHLKMLDTQGGNNCKIKIMATTSGADMSGVLMVHGGKHCHGKGTFDLTLQP